MRYDLVPDDLVAGGDDHALKVALGGRLVHIFQVLHIPNNFCYEFAGRLLGPREALLEEIEALRPKIKEFKAMAGGDEEN